MQLAPFRPTARVLAPAAIVLCIVAASTLIALPRLMHRTASPEFCGSCHVMDQEYESWFQSGGHATIRCVDCHLPNDNAANHYLWKSIDGNKDVLLFFSGMVSDRIDASQHARATIQKNCVRCHADMVTRMHTDAVRCYQCHRSKFHYRNP